MQQASLVCRSTAIVSSLVRLLASLACEGASSPLFSLSLSPSWMPMLMKETRLTRQKSIAQICTRDIEKERESEAESLCGAGRGRERENLTLRATNRSSWAVRVQRHTHHSLFPLSLSFGFFHCVVYALCLSSRTHHIDLLIVRPTKKSEKSALWKAKVCCLSQ